MRSISFKFILVIAILFFATSAICQHQKTDSLKKAILTSKEDTNKVDALNKLAWSLEFDDPDKALEISQTALELAKKLNYKKGEAQSLNDIGVCYSVLGKIQKSLSYYFESLKIKEEIKDERGIGISLINIGQVYSDQGQHDKGLEYYKKALAQFIKITNEVEIAATYNSIGTLFVEIDKLDTGKAYIEKALDLRAKNHDEDGVAECYHNLAVIYKSMGDLRKAIKYYELVKRFNEQKNEDYNTTITLNNLSLLYADLNDVDKAIHTAKESVEICSKKGYLENLKYAYGNLASFYRTKKDYENAYHYLSVYFSAVDSLKNQNLSFTLNDLAAKYETEKKDQRNKFLQAQNDLSEKTIKQQKLITYFIIIGFCIVTLLAFFIFRGLKKQRKANEIISEQKLIVEHQKQLVEEKHKEITDSINYAERIQRSFLATKHLLDENLNEYFVFFQPKDIVSGDFYWASKLSNGNFVLVTADSTGHGVPGAIMSILNISSLEKAVDQGLCEPSDILNHTRKTIIERLKKDGSIEGGKDGMDASLISIDFKKNVLTHAAANNPVWIVRQQQLIELSPDKMPVGKHDKDNVPFSQHSTQLQKNDLIYTLTDGFPDQFGGPLGKKYMYKKLKEMLIHISQLPMNEQKEILKTTLNTWKGDLEQVDDVCLIGVRI